LGIAVYYASNINDVNIFIAFIAGLVIGFLWFFLSFGILFVFGVLASFLLSLHPKRPSKRMEIFYVAIASVITVGIGIVTFEMSKKIPIVGSHVGNMLREEDDG
jgi:hypothetical protein